MSAGLMSVGRPVPPAKALSMQFTLLDCEPQNARIDAPSRFGMSAADLVDRE